MKRLLLIVTLLILILAAALGFWGNRLLARTLDAELPGLLSEVLGLPVTLAPIKTQPFQLTARSPELVMGDPADPAIVATHVEVSLAWSDLLDGELRLSGAKASQLMVRASRWPGNDNPWPDDYRFLEPWLPDSLELAAGHYVNDQGERYPLKQASWQRHTIGATLAWTILVDSRDVQLTAELKSLDELLRLARTQLELGVVPVSDQGTTGSSSRISLSADLKPDQHAGYQLNVDIQGGGMSAQLVTGNSTAWQLPAESKTSFDTLDATALNTLIKAYTPPSAPGESDILLSSTLPKLSLPAHQGSVAIGELRLGGELGTDTIFNFKTGAEGVEISSLSSNGPTGMLQGQARLASSEAGWILDLDADMTVREADSSLAPEYITANWLWRSGKLQLAGKGDSWSALLNSLTGHIQLAGSHRGRAQTPVAIEARLAQRPGELAFDDVKVQLGKASIGASIRLSGTEPRRLQASVKGEQMDLGFLFEEEESDTLAGVALPQFLITLPGIELNWELELDGLQVPGLAIATSEITVTRDSKHSSLTAIGTGRDGGTVELALHAKLDPGQPTDVTMQTTISRVSLPKLFQQENQALDSRSTGTISFESRGNGLEQLFEAMRGKASLEIEYRRDRDWQRAGNDKDLLQFSGDARLVITDKRIVGVEISRLDIESISQDVTGTLSMVSNRSPWVIADLEAEKLDLNGMLEVIPKSGAQADQESMLDTIRKLDPLKLSLRADSITLRNMTLSNAELELASAPDIFTIDKLNFSVIGGNLQSQGQISWHKQTTKLSIDATATNFDLDDFVIDLPDTPGVPVSGSIKLTSSGKKFDELISNLVGEVDLKASNPQASSDPADRRRLAMTARRSARGMQAQVSSFQWGENELSGKLDFNSSVPPSFELEVSGGAISLLPWEQKQVTKPAKNPSAKGITGIAETSANFVGNILLKPINFLSSSREAEPGKKFFSSKALPLDMLQQYHGTIHGRLDSFTTSMLVAKDISINARIKDQQLSLRASTGQLNSGTAELELDLNAAATPPSVSLTSSFSGVYRDPNKSSYPRSGFASLTSKGVSPAEMAANLSGLLYAKLGRGPIDFGNTHLLTADVGSAMFHALIPGLDQKPPELQCAVTLGVFKDGIGVTPYGYAARTREANLSGRVKLDLKKEMLELEFSSSNRGGVGISVGSVFSNTVRVKGPITDPQIVPKTGSLLWRGWAAFMTAGLSVVGESVLKRTLASSNPCDTIDKDIREAQCGANQLAASSPLVCPPT